MNMTVNEVLEKLRKPELLREPTRDLLIVGRPDAAVTGIVCVFTASVDAVRGAARLGANLILTHEPTFYNHTDDVADLAGDPVYEAKRALLEREGIAVFRYHDQPHAERPDEIIAGVVRALGWERYGEDLSQLPGILTLPEQSVADIAAHVKRALDIPYVRLVGDPAMRVTRVGLALGYSSQFGKGVPALRDRGLELLIAGESPEWETPEYVRDAVLLGERKAMLVLGHQRSEEAGMRLLAERLQAMLPGVPVRYVETRPALDTLL